MKINIVMGHWQFLGPVRQESGATPKNVDQRMVLRTHRPRCDLRFLSFRETFLMGHQMEHFSI